MIYYLIAVLGLIFGVLLFYKTPHVPSVKITGDLPTLSIIIPARNEERNIKELLALLTKTIHNNIEIIVVDDDSSDETYQIAKEFGVVVLKATSKPDKWLGKSWACFVGAKQAKGNQLLFLDADVRISIDEVITLLKASTKYPIFSVGPYHKTNKLHEQFSFYFNAVGLAANGFMLPFSYKKVGMFGPVIMIPKTTYFAVGGHEAVKGSIIEDVAFGKNLLSHHKDYELFLGNKQLTYQMYANGFSDLYHGWIKNFASGALKTSWLMLIMTIIWISVGFSVLIHIPQTLILQDWYMLAGWCLVLFTYLLQIARISKKIGNFKWVTIVFYPIYLLFFLYIFLISLIYKIFNLPVKWKDWAIKSR